MPPKTTVPAVFRAGGAQEEQYSRYVQWFANIRQRFTYADAWSEELRIQAFFQRRKPQDDPMHEADKRLRELLEQHPVHLRQQAKRQKQLHARPAGGGQEVASPAHSAVGDDNDDVEALRERLRQQVEQQLAVGLERLKAYHEQQTEALRHREDVSRQEMVALKGQ
eukprot:SAG31_NODE_18228_length_642_cov_2.439946_1_plen_165_part_10